MSLLTRGVSLTWVFLDAPLNDLSDVFEGGGVLVLHVVAERDTVAGVRTVAHHQEHRVEVGAGLFIATLLQQIMHLTLTLLVGPKNSLLH